MLALTSLRGNDYFLFHDQRKPLVETRIFRKMTASVLDA
jgi:hypothetical protein